MHVLRCERFMQLSPKLRPCGSGAQNVIFSRSASLGNLPVS
jgi:hypothetical protein